MSEMRALDFTADGTEEDGAADSSLMVMVTGTFGSGTLNIQRYSKARSAFVTVASFSAATTEAQEVRVGKGARIKFELTGATTPDIDVDYWFAA